MEKTRELSNSVSRPLSALNIRTSNAVGNEFVTVARRPFSAEKMYSISTPLASLPVTTADGLEAANEIREGSAFPPPWANPETAKSNVNASAAIRFILSRYSIIVLPVTVKNIMSLTSTKPAPTEYAPYYGGYILLVEGDVIDKLAAQPAQLRDVFAAYGDARGQLAYEQGKWTVKELLGHVIDGERMFAYRALRISRGDLTPIEGFEQDDYIANARSNERGMDDLLDEFELLRLANLIFFRHLNEADWQRKGTASGNAVSVRAIAYIMAGHVIHHINILRERYSV